jgi:hypothetical protein
MPKFAHVAERVPCPMCRVDLACNNRVGFQWGYCPYPYSDSEREGYRVGDPLLWRADTCGRVLAWRYFHDGTANIGDPRDADVVVREGEFEISRCPGCGWAFGGIGVVIRDGRIEAVQVFPKWPPGVDIFVVGPAGELVPRPDWYDRPMPGIAAGGPTPQLLTTAEAQVVAEAPDAELGAVPDTGRV